MPDYDQFHPGERSAQQRWQTERQWDAARREQLLLNHIPEPLQQRIADIAFFFVATSAADGSCDCSFKGGGPGVIRVLDERRLAFADYDGNGAFMTVGNILENPQVGLLFVDFGDGGRLRVNGRATVHDDGPIAALFPDQPRVILVDIDLVVPNCAAHVPRLAPVTG